MEKTVKLKDGTQVLIRPMTRDDVDKSYAFFQALPDQDRAYLRRDVSRRDIVERRIQEMESGSVKRLVAVVKDEIVADGALELSGHGWEEHVGELRMIVARPYQRKGLGMLVASELYGLAASEKVEEIVVKMMRPQVGARNIFHKLGFREEGLLFDYAKDMGGRKQDVILMRCHLEELWKKLEDLIDGSDWQRTR